MFTRALLASAIAAVVIATPRVATQDGNIILNVPEDKHVAVRVGSSFDGNMFNVDEIPAQVQALRDDFVTNADLVNLSIAGIRTTTEAALNAMRASATATNNATQTTLSQLEARINDQVTIQLAGATAAAAAAAAAANAAAAAASRAYNASICSAGGQLYNSTTNSCYDSTAGLGDPDWQSNWAYMRSQRGAFGSYKEWTWCTPAARCTERPERVTLTMRAYQFGDIRDLVTFEGAGAATCDDESTCDDHGGAVFAYDPTRIRVWLPDQSNGRPYGLAIQVGDGWGDGQRNIQAHEVQVMAKVWTKHRKDEQPYFDTTFQMRSGAGAPRNTAFKEITYNANGRRPGFPDRMLVETSPISGPNRGFAFVSKGASVHDNDGGKDYGGLVSAYNMERLRLWSPTSANGMIIFVKDGWGGERNAQWERIANIRVRVWARTEQNAPDFETPRFPMWSNCGGATCSWNPSSHFGKSFQTVAHGLGTVPSRVLVTTYMDRGVNNGYCWEAISGGGGDDDQDGRTGLIMGYDDRDVLMWAPTRSNGRTTGRIAGVHDGWGFGVNNQAEQGVLVKVQAWK